MIKVNLSCANGIIHTEALQQWDFGQVMEATGLDTQKDDIEVHFANRGSDKAIITVGKYEDGKIIAKIPDVLLTTGKDVLAFFYESDATSGRTIRTTLTPVTKRSKPEDYVVPEAKDYLFRLLEQAEKTIMESQKIVDEAQMDKNRLADLEIYKANSITQTLACDTIVTTDSAKVGLVGMKTYGKSTQKRHEGNQPSPSPEYPQEIVSVGDEGSVVEKVLTSQLFDVNARKSTNFSNEITIDNDDWMSYKVDNTNGSNDKYVNFFTRPNEFLIENKVYMAVIEVDTLTDSIIVSVSSASEKLDVPSQFSNMVSATTSGIHCKQATTKESFDNSASSMRGYIMVPKGKKGIGKFRISLIEDLTVTADTFVYEPYTEQSLTLQTPNGLPGIPLGKTIPDVIKNSAIHMSGVYWDSDEEQYYIADTVDYGKGEYVQRILRGNLDGSSAYGFNNNGVWHLSAGNIKTIFNGNIISFGENSYYNPAISDCFIIQNSSYNVDLAEQWKNTIYLSDTGEEMSLYASLFPSVDNEGFKAFFTEHPTKIYVIAESPITTPLTEEELIQYKSLHMNYPNTTIINDEGAYMEVEYVADTKSYIEQNYTPKSEIEEMKNQIAELQSLVVNNV